MGKTALPVTAPGHQQAGARPAGAEAAAFSGSHCSGSHGAGLSRIKTLTGASQSHHPVDQAGHIALLAFGGI